MNKRFIATKKTRDFFIFLLGLRKKGKKDTPAQLEARGRRETREGERSASAWFRPTIFSRQK